MIDNAITSVRIQSSNNYCGLRYWELKCSVDDERFNRFNLLVSTMQDMGIARTLNSRRKVTDWLNSEEGLKWINERKEDWTSTGLGMFL